MNRILKMLQEMPEDILGGHGFAPLSGLGLHGGGGGTETQTSKSEPWSGQQPYLRQGYQAASNLLREGGQQYFPGSTVATPSRITQDAAQRAADFRTSEYQRYVQQAAGLSTNRLLGGEGNATADIGSQLAGGTTDTLGQLISGGQSNLQQNPYTDQLVQKAIGANTQNFTQNVVPRIESNAIADGGFGGSRQGLAEGLAAGELNRQNAETAAGIYSDQYNQDAARQIDRDRTQLAASQVGLNATQQGQNFAQQGAAQAGSLLPSMQQLPINAMNVQAQAGGQLDAYRQNLINEEINRFMFEQQAPSEALSQYTQAIQGNPGGSSSTQTPGPNPWAQAAGGALTGAGLYGATAAALAPSATAAAGGATAPLWLSNPWTAPLFLAGGALASSL